ncbi:DNA repair protein RAD51-like protein 2 [Trichoplax sp. H2]|nr:DNA repair protein RAD51-like protein 2 [Trichoplax sp. H2]|eukprot:RDD37656.1 DNA repair protein RAD51-like protein 2 [Trichoplax sp. H2]
MSYRKIKAIGLSHELVDVLLQHKITTCKDILALSNVELMNMTGLSYQHSKDVIQSASRSVSPNAQTAASLFNPIASKYPAYLSTSLSPLDCALRGGLRLSNLTELVGPPGSGKTQFCIMLSILATLPNEMLGLDGSTIYIDTEASFTAERLVEMATCKFPEYFSNREHLSKLTQRVCVSVQLESRSLVNRQALLSLEEDIIKRNVKLIIVDSIASPVRKEFDRTSSTQRGQILSKQAAILKRIAEAFSIPIIITNQITTSYNQRKNDSINDEDVSNIQADDSSTTAFEDHRPHIIAALGETWAHNVNTRLFLEPIDDTRKKITIMKSPVAATASLNYVIESKGIVVI